MLNRFRFFCKVVCFFLLTTAVAQASALFLKGRPKIALVLGGGAAKGFAHIGAIKALEDHDIFPDIIVGTSAGSVVGGLYAAGYTGFQLQALAFSLEFDVLDDIAWSATGLLKGERLQAYINQLVKGRPIEKLNKMFGAVATDLKTGRAVLFRSGNTGQAVRASSSIPGVFQPTMIAGRRYIDGTVVSPVPVEFAKKMGANFIIAIDISGQLDISEPNDAVEIMYQSLNIMEQRISHTELNKADVVVRPRIGDMDGSDFDMRYTAILEGEKAMKQQLPYIKRMLQIKTATLKESKKMLIP